MRRSLVFAAVLLLVSGALAQQRHGGMGSPSPAPRPHVTPTGSPGIPANRPAHGGGGIVSPGPGRPAHSPGNTLSVFDPTFAKRLGDTVSRLPARSVGMGPTHRAHPYGGFYLPYSYPVYVGGYYDGYYGGYDAGYQQPNLMAYPQQTSPPQVVINQYFTPETAKPVIQEVSQQSNGVSVYDAPTPQPAESSQPVESKFFLVAFKDHSVYTAMAYWIEGDTLHYITTKGVHNQASLDLIDRAFSQQLNRERGMDFNLPANR